ncbi:hypothetical protein EVAR_78848_1 [Eumeta japonica]|uniref:Uncharacterized protein n=1 Tax=Eumeta variegata TaxID=151549 RepID=A0A4C1U275_EUMVA|nr:hypothetical protein EVAR_78848_1 [Eumeta japonica]
MPREGVKPKFYCVTKVEPGFEIKDEIKVKIDKKKVQNQYRDQNQEQDNDRDLDFVMGRYTKRRRSFYVYAGGTVGKC